MGTKTFSFNTEPKNAVGSIWRRLTSCQGYIGQSKWDGIKYLILFIGYPRSGHSLLGSIINAVPQCGMSHELDALYYVQKGYTRQQLFYLISNNIKNFNTSGRKWMGYDYDMGGDPSVNPFQWSHIGDKCGGRTTRRVGVYDDLEGLDRAAKLANAKLRLLHVVRNPLDNITTMAIRTQEKTSRLIENTLDNAIKRYAVNVKVNKALMDRYGATILTIHYENLIINFDEQMRIVFDHLDLEPSEKFLTNVKAKIWKDPKRSRMKIQEHWTIEKLEMVQELCRKYDFLNFYEEEINFQK